MSLQYQQPAFLFDPVTGVAAYKNPVTGKEVTFVDPYNADIRGGTINQTPLSYINTKGFGTPTRKVIIDTDWWTDVDDVLAMRMAFEFERLGVWDILGVAISTTLAAGPRSLDMLALFDGRANLPIFIPTTSHVPGGTPPYQTNMLATTLPGGASSTLTSGSIGTLNVPGAVAGLTRLLQDATAPVEVISIGYPVNLYELLLAQPALVASKVSKVWMMAGQWPSGSENNFTRTAQSRTAGNYICANWPTPITFLGFEIGQNIRTGGSLAQLSASDPVAKALVDYTEPWGRQSWDPMMVLLAASGDVTKGGYTSVRGMAAVNASTGANSFTVQANGLHEYVVRSVGDNYYANTINDLVVPNSSRKSFKNADGTTFYAPTLPRSNIGQNFIPVLGATTDADNLLHFWCADDTSDIADSSLVDTVYDRVRGTNGRTMTSTSTLRPPMTTQGGLRAWNFSGAQALGTVGTAVPPEVTVYAKVRFAGGPGSAQSIVANEQDSSTFRSFHLKVANGISSQAVSINSFNATVDSANASQITTATWHVLAFRRSVSSLEALFNGASDGPTALSAPGNSVAVPIIIGAKRTDATSEPLTGYVRAVRIYAGVHTDAQIAAVSAEMT